MSTRVKNGSIRLCRSRIRTPRSASKALHPRCGPRHYQPLMPFRQHPRRNRGNEDLPYRNYSKTRTVRQTPLNSNQMASRRRSRPAFRRYQMHKLELSSQTAVRSPKAKFSFDISTGSDRRQSGVNGIAELFNQFLNMDALNNERWR